MYFFTSDEHYGHKNIIKYQKRPFSSIEEMDEELIKRHNEVVEKNDITIHAGDFALTAKEKVPKYIKRLNGNHTFLWGSHDRWLSNPRQILDKKIDGQRIVICHYAMRTWPASHYGSWHLYGHSHGHLSPIGKSWDIGVDNNNFYPLSFDDIKKIMEETNDNNQESDK